MRYRLAIGCISLALCACSAVPTRTPLDTKAKTGLSSTQAYVHVAQDEIIVRAEASGVAAAMGGGLIPALIDSSIDKGRQGAIQSSIEPFYAAVDDLDVRKQLVQSLRTALADNFAVKVTTVDGAAFRLDGQALETRRVALKPDTGFLQIGMTYSFSQNFQRLSMKVRADLWRGGVDTPIYSNDLHYQSAPVGSGGSDSLKAWAGNNGAKYRQTIDEAVAELISMLKLDASAAATDATSTKQATAAMFTGAVSMNVAGPLLDSKQGRLVIRNGNGALYSLPQ